ncbi:MAG: hypothetical protein HYU36_18010 [Planctomycetes bacterium]|nr:hypothetical protein [Planctomycetota bacterium]
MAIITVVCTKCGKANQTEKKTFRYKIRCLGCNHLVSVGGLEPSIRALPVTEISIVLGLLFLVVGPFAIYKLFLIEKDPLDIHRVLVEATAKDLVNKGVDPAWKDVKLLYVSPQFNENFTVAWTKIAYKYSNGGWEKSVEFPMRYILRTKKDKEGEEGLVWEPEYIGFVDSSEKPRGIVLPELPEGDWSRYRWETFNPDTHAPLIRGVRPKP